MKTAESKYKQDDVIDLCKKLVEIRKDVAMQLEKEVRRLDNTIQPKETHFPEMPLPEMMPQEMLKIALSLRPKDNGRYEEWADAIIERIRNITLIALEKYSQRPKTMEEVDEMLGYSPDLKYSPKQSLPLSSIEADEGARNDQIA